MPRRNKPIKHVYRNVKPGATCDSKRQFINEREAVKAAEFQMLVNLNLELAVYQCDACFKWHLTKSKK
ncbi:hypothetical protein COV88_02265 [Candidatus Saccharibacteria bacterium CG11_big_fil_rev_8_21_14_0_20_41_19]|nr:MAG: hypothetical protein AUK57_03160 [Candidatus Saccharibacteria bacterium CG2_30_41_52]PIQ70942.1 MAG: hypothetical protein COV88_02265 [Candidatus Saccharibacteria bacterium CG11_big_fil_rev_8_21_14_0_20_41_19]PIZ60744.1 MAG: hypothetical protein COY18_00710 [Candidatus Saccharibacteria bacterium CG_4_10_14_0_2_um_filter_41_11]PJC29399.1 MAG: hypothetical protein CO052_03535 [Candidatus Saccharibacteria bacterium CG_4_9_14_0_2_um_filter_41_9]PJE65863.1 MAG: hypothetical protein COU92_039